MNHRRVVLILCVGLMLLTTACNDWPMFAGGPAHTGFNGDESTLTAGNVGSLQLAYRVNVGSPAPPRTQVNVPAISNGRVYTTAGNGRLIVSDAAGSTNCSGTPIVCEPLWTAAIGGKTYATATVAGNRVFTATGWDTATPTLAAFDANGSTGCAGIPKSCTPLWTAPVSSVFGPTVVDNILYIHTLDALAAYDATGSTNCGGVPVTCRPLWTAPTTSYGTPTVADGRVYSMSGTTGVLSVFDAGGTSGCSGSPKVCQPLWTGVSPGPSSGSVAVADGVAYLATTGNQLPESGHFDLVAFDATGVTNCTGSPAVCQPLWTGDLPEHGVYSTPAVANGRIYAVYMTGLSVFSASPGTNCSSTPVRCTPAWTGDSSPFPGFGATYVLTSPVVTNNLAFVGGLAFGVSGSANCTAAPVPACRPLFNASPPLGNARDGSTVAGGRLYLPELESSSLEVYRLP